MVLAVGGDPENGPAFKRQRPAHGEKIFEQPWGLEPAVRVQPVVTEADAEADRQPVQHERGDDVGPGEKPERRDRRDMEKDHENGGNPIDGRI